MMQLFTPDFDADMFRQRVDLFCFTDIRLDITPQQSMQLQEQLLRTSDILTSIIATYFNSENPCRYDHISIKAARLAKRFKTIAQALEQEGIDRSPLDLFKRELATSVYEDCVAMNDCDLYDALNSFLYRPERQQRQSRAIEPERDN